MVDFRMRVIHEMLVLAAQAVLVLIRATPSAGARLTLVI
eukprot:COSAG02_NODE_890_length_16155_cov_63.407885_9_plen_39_part_00